MKTSVPMSVCILALALAACTVDQQSTGPAIRASVDSDEYEIVDLGMFGTGSQAFGINDKGEVFGRYFLGPTDQRSFRWTEKNGFEDLGDFGGFPFQFLRSNKHGDLVGWVPTTPFGTFGNLRAVVWTKQRGFRFIDEPQYNSQARYISKHGDVTGNRNIPGPGGSPGRGFIWNEKTGVTIIPPHPSAATPGNTALGAMNERGDAVGSTSFKTTPTAVIESRAFIWNRASGMQLLPTFGGLVTGASDINDDRVVVGAAEMRPPLPGEIRRQLFSFMPGDVPVHAWRWTESGGLEDLGTLGGKHSVAWAVDQFGNAYGWAMNASGQQRAVKWTHDGQIIELGTLGGATSQTGAINKHGVLAGQAATPSGELHAVLYVPR